MNGGHKESVQKKVLPNTFNSNITEISLLIDVYILYIYINS